VLALLVIIKVARELIGAGLQQLIFGVIALLELNGHVPLVMLWALLFFAVFLEIPKLRDEILNVNCLYIGRPQIFQVFSLLPQVVLEDSPLWEVVLVQRLELLFGLDFGVETPHLSVEYLLSHLLDVFFELLNLMAVELVNILKSLIQTDGMFSLNKILKVVVQSSVELHGKYLLL
jgi:hypothetical protein